MMAFVYDAIDQDVGNTLRELNPGPHYKQDNHQWLNMKDFRAKFERVFKKGPFQESFDLMREAQACSNWRRSTEAATRIDHTEIAHYPMPTPSPITL